MLILQATVVIVLLMIVTLICCFVCLLACLLVSLPFCSLSLSLSSPASPRSKSTPGGPSTHYFRTLVPWTVWVPVPSRCQSLTELRKRSPACGRPRPCREARSAARTPAAACTGISTPALPPTRLGCLYYQKKVQSEYHYGTRSQNHTIHGL